LQESGLSYSSLFADQNQNIDALLSKAKVLDKKFTTAMKSVKDLNKELH
jgi:hypothetical protein